MKLLLCLVLLLAGCGGGTVGDVTINCTVPNACPVTVGPNTIGGSVTIGGPVVPAPGPAASAPLPPPPAASAPTPAPVAVPFGRVVTAPPVRDEAGNLRWTSGGRTYQVRVFDGTFATWVALYSFTGVPADNSTLISETVLDDALDIHSAEVADDAAIRAWLVARIVPALNLWLSAHPMDAVALPVSTAAVPATVTGYDRAAARLPQWVAISGSPARATVLGP